MASDFSRTLALLRREKKISQRTAAADLGVSQALLSHYENGLREPGPVSYTHLLTISIFSYPVLAIYNAGAALFRAQGNSNVSMMIAGLTDVYKRQMVACAI